MFYTPFALQLERYQAAGLPAGPSGPGKSLCHLSVIKWLEETALQKATTPVSYRRYR